MWRRRNSVVGGFAKIYIYGGVPPEWTPIPWALLIHTSPPTAWSSYHSILRALSKERELERVK